MPPKKLALPLTIVLTVVALAAGATWTLAGSLSERPTAAAVQRTIQAHERAVHHQTARALESLRHEMREQHKELRDLILVHERITR